MSEPATLGQTLRLLNQLRTHGVATVERLDRLAAGLNGARLDSATLGDVAEILDAAHAFTAAVDTAANGLSARHGAIAEAVTTTPHAASAAFYRDDSVSFAGLDRDARLAAMRSEIDAAVQRMADPAGWKAFLESAAKFHQYSLHNTLLAISQNPDATLLAGYKDWQRKHGRTVRKGEKAIWIYAPATRRVTEADPDSGEEQKTQQVVGFRPVPVFDYASTEGAPLPQPPRVDSTPLDGDAPAGLLDHLAQQITERGFTLDDEQLDGRDGYTNFTEHRVVVDQNASSRQRALILAHELAHIALGHGGQTRDYHTDNGGRRSDMEIEAESVAYIIARHHGITDAGDSAFGYITDWAHGDIDKVRATADRVLNAARQLTHENGDPQP